MPYITQERREALDPKIEAIQETLSQKDRGEGDLNYTLSRIVAGAFEDEPRYHTIARITGVLENVKQEFYRRVAAPYEDEAIKKNGDINEYYRWRNEAVNECSRPGCAGPANCPCESPAFDIDNRGGA